MRRYYEPNSLWLLTGFLKRISQRLAIHQTTCGPDARPFDVEMKRRLYWQVDSLDVYAGKLAGMPFTDTLEFSEDQIPLNVSDSELFFSMKVLPVDRPGVTEMLFVRLRCELMRGLKLVQQESTSAENLAGEELAQAISKKDKIIDEVEESLRSKYLQFCDPSIPLHAVTLCMVTGVISR